MKHERHRKPRPPLDEEALERLGLFYAGRYGTTRAKLAAYLTRKIRERGWAGNKPPEVERLVERFAALGYVDDRAFAAARASSLLRRGYGERRIDQAFRAAGIGAEDAAPAKGLASDGAMEAALLYARRRRIGPYAESEPDRAQRQKSVAAMLRAGHPIDLVRKVMGASPGEIPDLDDA